MNPPFKAEFIDLAEHAGYPGRSDTQHGWLDLVRERFQGLRVLDVGCGLSTTKARLPASTVFTQDVAPVPCDHPCPIAEITGTYDALLCLDVIEHVRNYGAFAHHLARLTTRWLFLTTPGFTVTRNLSPYHFHEFYPWEILQLLEATGLGLVSAWSQRWAGPAEFDGHTPANLLSGVEPTDRDTLLTEQFLHPVALLMGTPVSLDI